MTYKQVLFVSLGAINDVYIYIYIKHLVGAWLIHKLI